jgi:hypothetical protein
MSGCHAPIAFERLVDYWLGDVDAAVTDAIDEHLLGCDSCGARLDEVIALAGGVRAAFDAGRVGTFVTAAFVAALAARGKRVREYRVPLNGSVACGIAPDDDLVVGRLQLPALAGVTRLDALLRTDEGEVRRIEDVPFDRATGEVLNLPQPAMLRRLMTQRRVIRLLAVDAGGERVVGDYTLNHSPRRRAERP